MKNFILTITCFFVIQFSNAQQVALSSQYMFNDFIFNPAIAGVKNYTPISLSLRRQWVGIKEAPVTQRVSAHGYLGLNLGCGGYIINEVTGPTRRTSANFSVAYHMKLSESKSSKEGARVLSFGLAATLSQHKYDVTKLSTYEPDDIAIMNTLNYQVIPDASAGIYFNEGNKYYIGLSAFHLVQTKKDLFEIVTPFDNSFKRTYYLTGEYNVLLNNDFSIRPSIMAEMIEAKPFQLDLNSKFVYQKQYWLGLGYRLKDAIIVSLGVQKGMLRFGYSYDYTLSAIRSYSSGSHEISLTLLLGYDKDKDKDDDGDDTKKKKRSRKKKGSFKPEITDF